MNSYLPDRETLIDWCAVGLGAAYLMPAALNVASLLSLYGAEWPIWAMVGLGGSLVGWGIGRSLRMLRRGGAPAEFWARIRTGVDDAALWPETRIVRRFRTMAPLGLLLFLAA